MKVLLLLLVLLCMSCEKVKDRIEVVTVDSCEYIVTYAGYNIDIIHKQNCKFCQQRKGVKE